MTGKELWELYNSYGEVYSQPLNEEYEELDEVTGGGLIKGKGTTYSSDYNLNPEKTGDLWKSNLSAAQMRADAGSSAKRSKYARDSQEQNPVRNSAGGSRSPAGAESGLAMTPRARAEGRAKSLAAKGGKYAKAANRIRREVETNKNLNASYDYDLYDLVLEYLLDEGLCESVENAEIMMAHMSEQWIDSIVESSEDSNTAGELARLRAQMRTAMQKGDDSSIKSISQRLSEIQAGARYKIGAELKGKTRRKR
jgi:hypothetical protein